MHIIINIWYESIAVIVLLALKQFHELWLIGSYVYGCSIIFSRGYQNLYMWECKTLSKAFHEWCLWALGHLWRRQNCPQLFACAHREFFLSLTELAHVNFHKMALLSINTLNKITTHGESRATCLLIREFCEPLWCQKLYDGQSRSSVF